MFKEYSSDEEDFNPYTFDKCPYGYYKGCCPGTCCKRCMSEIKEERWRKESKRLFYEYLKEQFDEVFLNENKYEKYKEYKILDINYNKFIILNKKDKLKKVKKQYRRLSLKHHPDKLGGSNESFNNLKNAFDYLYSIWFHS
tara:strand:+ start:119 stop:541 length:423 start_codon:yes stop_codon:yes gene_type:complete